eukprot:CAMPEP_0198358622 /NCGR_PEP_ID=MMETSP1450-20131203/131543_1 /TAXON_ID=753684 ORGANISM="Madagascaria erythrocladiodes, Strain CCMP3234" /NCGR_SAMPLE_ID=MMETSP1450 /ASSEMBLY_ACC=CAM_ASM_001115 /LENGTH=70 /DNA_ID=CAMNT_0044065385 /DNA_START=30 /DNA_END=239 /DNA_ORIENTATION=-
MSGMRGDFHGSLGTERGGHYALMSLGVPGATAVADNGGNRTKLAFHYTYQTSFAFAQFGGDAPLRQGQGS